MSIKLINAQCQFKSFVIIVILGTYFRFKLSLLVIIWFYKYSLFNIAKCNILVSFKKLKNNMISVRSIFYQLSINNAFYEQF